MEANRRYTLMAFPQAFDGTTLRLNIVLIPRNRNPLVALDTGLPTPATVTGFADVVPQFEACLVRGTDEFPWDNATTPARQPVRVPLTVAPATRKKELLVAIEKEFAGKLTLDHKTDSIEAKAKVLPESASLRKYLPRSYQDAFNFTRPRHPNAVTDDSYACALRDNVAKQVLPNQDDISWGQVFGYILRQPLLARACGLVYETQLTVKPDWFAKGGYLYVDMTASNDAAYASVQQTTLNSANGAFVKRYAARIPALKAGESRPVFAPILFPVLWSGSGTDPSVPDAPWDEIYPEVNEYGDGFAKIVHANQPVSGNLLAEAQDGFHPVNDLGIRLGWDDEQILLWYLRQLTENPAPTQQGSGERIDAPLGVLGYRVDVREDKPGTNWESLNAVRARQSYLIGGKAVGNGPQEQIELPYQVYPTKLVGSLTATYWLPMYYSNWIGRSLVQKDSDAARLYQNDKDKYHQKPDPVHTDQLFDAVGPQTALCYGRSYQFRVRLTDLSGGGPTVSEKPVQAAPSPQARIHFKRYVTPSLLRLEKPVHVFTPGTRDRLFNQTDENKFDPAPTLTIQRPLLGYPAVVFTNKYQKNGLNQAVELLIQKQSAPAGPQVDVGLADPDVTKVEVLVEVETLRMDNRLSRSGRENYIPLYTTYRPFPAGFDDKLNLPVRFRDEPKLLFEQTNPFSDATLDLTNGPLWLPTARRVRLTLRAVCDGDGTYFGHLNEQDRALDSRYGQSTQLSLFAPSTAEPDLLQPAANVPPVQALYLQPDAAPGPLDFSKLTTLLLRNDVGGNQPDVVQRVAGQLGLQARGMTLVGAKGERVVFGCSNRIRHSLAPDHSSITFASKADLIHHWLGCLVFRLDRDWTWDGLEPVSFTVERWKKFRHDADSKAETGVVGDIEMKHTASFEAQQPDRFGLINRDRTLLVFIDAIEPKANTVGYYPPFPDELEVRYTLTPQPQSGYPAMAPPKTEPLRLPTTTLPAQMPKLASAGLAFSPYEADEKYSATQPRQQFLWFEFTQPVLDPHDTLFCRVLANAPDQLLSNNGLDILEALAPVEPPLPIDPEYIRVITPGQSQDLAGLGAMQPMQKATDSDRHYLVPLPPGLHADSPVLFGFFTYEIRVGHDHRNDRDDNRWSTAQARFGRALRVTGVQHPAPTLLCTVNRDQKRVSVSAPYAQAVINGRNVTANPPRTGLWALLYAQVRQADGRAYRNILLNDQRLSVYSTKPDPKPLMGEMVKASLTAESVAQDVPDAVYKDLPKTGLAFWENAVVTKRLEELGLPDDAPLSIIVVEVFSNITNVYEHVTNLPGSNAVGLAANPATLFGGGPLLESVTRLAQELADQRNPTVAPAETNQVAEGFDPLSNGLGHSRILRTSPLTPVPFVCCTDC